MRHQSVELIEKRVAPLRGRKLSPAQIEALRKAHTGKRHRPETIAKLRALHPEGIVPKLSPEAEARRCKAISEQRKGCHGYGRATRDRLDHFKALHWIIRDPRGFIHEFDNLQSWARANEWRFLPDDKPESKLKLWKRAVGGFNNMQRTDRKGQHHWKGWTLVSVLERKEQGAPDLLQRESVTAETHCTCPGGPVDQVSQSSNS